MRYFVTLVLAVAALLGFSAPAEARPARTPSNGIKIEYVNTINSSWDVRGAVSDIDWYTGSYWVASNRCHAGVRCVVIKKGKLKGIYGYSHACRPAIEACRITIDVDRAAKSKLYTPATKRWLVRHELGHYRTLSHRGSCDSTMYKYVRCPNGKLPPYAFTSAERAILKRN